MTQGELNFEAPAPGDLFAYDTQNYKIYAALRSGGIQNVEIVEQLGVYAYTRRISDIRDALKPHNLTVKKINLRGHIFLYILRKI
jgi:hypothetical protein